ncbi:uncharacterized protein Z518_11238 [Rhinocladiella mackenziei CBS 650.93]|uniref:RRM domain-containing protein n=1 Tax=Rhinocladiella mackenziei CBS 650.93 TaxID=1442369 RepID=A0A0D2IS27_9EURO|nr:uncharacterized protein Z518_11238 [Rhinocladiella mackenziei CBS 650.93]KIW99499.1 hypothetical protein Z518_11238 [Rhinocladiella mackenziei CBS 650.93]
MGDTSSPPAPRQYQNFRSQISTNWRIKDDSPRLEQPQSRSRYSRSNGHQHSNSQSIPHSASDDAPGTRLYVGNLPYTAQKADIESLFTGHGFKVVGVSISTDPFTGRNPSYCFVNVETAEEAERAMTELNGVEVLGRAVRVSPGVAKREQGQGQGPGQNGSGGREARVRNVERGWGRETRQERNSEYKPTFDRWSRTDAPSHWLTPQSEGRRLYIGNLPRMEPQSAVDEEIQSLFSTYLSEFGIAPMAVSKLISPRPSKAGEPGNHHYCFVDLERAEDVDIVIEKLDGKEGRWDGTLRVNRAKEHRERGAQDRKVIREQGLNMEDRRGSGSGG